MHSPQVFRLTRKIPNETKRLWMEDDRDNTKKQGADKIKRLARMKT